MSDTQGDSELIITTHQRTLMPWRELAYLASICMELSWGILWYRTIISFGGNVTYGRAFIVLGGMFLSSYFLKRLADLFNFNIALRWMVTAGLLLGSYLVGLKTLLYSSEVVYWWDLFMRPIRSFADLDIFIPDEFILVLYILFVCWRGLSVGSRQIESSSVTNGFRRGVFLFLGYGLLFPISDKVPGNAMYIFLFSSLMAMSAVRISALSRQRGGQRIPFDKGWFIGIALVGLGVVSIVAPVARLTRGKFFTLIADIYSRVLSALLVVLMFLFSPLLWLLAKFLDLLEGWLYSGELNSVLDGILDAIQSFLLRWDNFMREMTGMNDSPFLGEFFRTLLKYKSWMLWGSVLLLGLFIISMALRRFVRKGDLVGEGEYQSLLEQGDLMNILRANLRRRLEVIAEGLERVFGLRQATRLLAAARIRRVYSRLMELSAKLGNPRPASRTPLEFLPKLVTLFPSSTAELETITNAYLRVRYGDLPETREEVEVVEMAWNRVSADGQEQLKARKII